MDVVLIGRSFTLIIFVYYGITAMRLGQIAYPVDTKIDIMKSVGIGLKTVVDSTGRREGAALD